MNAYSPEVVRMPLWFRLMVSAPAICVVIALVWLAFKHDEASRLLPIPFVFLGWLFANSTISLFDLLVFLVFVPMMASIFGGFAQAAGVDVSPHYEAGMWFSAPVWLATSLALSFGLFVFGKHFERIDPLRIK